MDVQKGMKILLKKRINERIMESQKAQYDIIYFKNTKKLRSGMVTDDQVSFIKVV